MPNACWPHRVEVQIDGLVLPVIGLADLKTNKRATGRPQGIADLHRLGAADDAPD